MYLLLHLLQAHHQNTMVNTTCNTVMNYEMSKVSCVNWLFPTFPQMAADQLQRKFACHKHAQFKSITSDVPCHFHIFQRNYTLLAYFFLSSNLIYNACNLIQICPAQLPNALLYIGYVIWIKNGSFCMNFYVFSQIQCDYRMDVVEAFKFTIHIYILLSACSRMFRMA